MGKNYLCLVLLLLAVTLFSGHYTSGAPSNSSANTMDRAAVDASQEGTTGAAAGDELAESAIRAAAAGDPVQGAIRVPATVVWAEPGQLREYDSLILAENPDPQRWADGMDTAMRQWLVGKAATMLLYGERVAILEERNGWLKIAAPGHRTAQEGHGYPGWVPADHVVSCATYLNKLDFGPQVVVREEIAHIFADPGLRRKLATAGYMVTLPLLGEVDDALAVCLPGGEVGYLSRAAVKADEELEFSPEGIVAEAMRFLGLRYLWAGTSAYGFDCSGFVMRLYQSQGKIIPRDAGEQAAGGIVVDREDLQPGDLVFFAKPGRTVHHVGLYIGDGRMIHSPGSNSAVKIDAITGGTYQKDFWGARRYEGSGGAAAPAASAGR